LEEIKIGIIPTIAHYLVPDMFGIWQESLKNVKLSIEEMKDVIKYFDVLDNQRILKNLAS
jgi:hypothetical protein